MNNNNNEKWIDPIVEEVRQTREKLFKKYNESLDEYAKDIKNRELEMSKLGMKFVSLSH